MIKREKYIAPIREFYDSDLIKVITGIRRCGKSVILREIFEEIRAKSENLLYLDFEDAAVLSALFGRRAMLPAALGAVPVALTVSLVLEGLLGVVYPLSGAAYLDAAAAAVLFGALLSGAVEGVLRLRRRARA